jgi:hypothetical protein
MWLAAIGSLIGLALPLTGARLLKSFRYGVSTNDRVTFTASPRRFSRSPGHEGVHAYSDSAGLRNIRAVWAGNHGVAKALQAPSAKLRKPPGTYRVSSSADSAAMRDAAVDLFPAAAQLSAMEREAIGWGLFGKRTMRSPPLQRRAQGPSRSRWLQQQGNR